MSNSTDRPWRDPALPAAERVGLLLQAMTLEEKVAQLGSRWAGNDMADSDLPEDETINVAPMEDVFSAGGAQSNASGARVIGCANASRAACSAWRPRPSAGLPP